MIEQQIWQTMLSHVHMTCQTIGFKFISLLHAIAGLCSWFVSCSPWQFSWTVVFAFIPSARHFLSNALLQCFELHDFPHKCMLIESFYYWMGELRASLASCSWNECFGTFALRSSAYQDWWQEKPTSKTGTTVKWTQWCWQSTPMHLMMAVFTIEQDRSPFLLPWQRHVKFWFYST